MNTAMILAAGRGERMRPLTDTLPKPLLEIAGKALIVYHIEALVRSGFSRIVINHAWLGRKITEALGDGSRWGVELLYSAERTALETAGGIIRALPLLCPGAQDEHFLVVNGDVFCNADFCRFPKPAANDLAHLMLVDNPAHNPNGDFALQQERVTSKGDGCKTFSGIACYHRGLFENQQQGISPLAPLLRAAMDEGKVSGHLHRGYWHDVGTPARLAQLNEEFAHL